MLLSSLVKYPLDNLDKIHVYTDMGGKVLCLLIKYENGLVVLGCDDRNSRFTISVRNSSTESTVCAYQHSQATKPSQTFTCSTPIVGREVDFIRDVGYVYSTLCEVIVMGHQYTGSI